MGEESVGVGHRIQANHATMKRDPKTNDSQRRFARRVIDAKNAGYTWREVEQRYRTTRRTILKLAEQFQLTIRP